MQKISTEVVSGSRKEMKSSNLVQDIPVRVNNIGERALPGSATTWQLVMIARHGDTAFWKYETSV